MTTTSNIADKISNVVIKERWLDLKYTREHVAIDLTIDGLGEQPISIGEIVYQDLDIADSPFRRIARSQAFPTNFRVGIVVDERIGDLVLNNQQSPDWSINSTDTVYLAVIVKGDCVVRRSGLSFATSAVTSVAENTALTRLGQQGIRIEGAEGTKFQVIKPYVI